MAPTSAVYYYLYWFYISYLSWVTLAPKYILSQISSLMVEWLALPAIEA